LFTDGLVGIVKEPRLRLQLYINIINSSAYTLRGAYIRPDIYNFSIFIAWRYTQNVFHIIIIYYCNLFVLKTEARKSTAQKRSRRTTNVRFLWI